MAIGTIVLQAFVAGVGSAHALRAAPDAFGVVCHGTSGASLNSDSNTIPAGLPDADKAAQDCCLFCTAAAPATVKEPSIVAWAPLRQAATVQPVYRPAPVIARAAVRAGRSQAPPRLA